MEKKTVFVIGAGASKEVKLPTGEELKKKIIRLLDIRFDFFRQESGDFLITEALKIHTNKDGGRGDINPYLHEAWHIRDALPQAISIDNFIDSQRENEKIALCGKLAIVRSILGAEKKSLLFFEKFTKEPGINFRSLESTWYTPFFQLLTENRSANELEGRFQSISLIIFNYDRCVEYFLFHSLQNYYKISQDDAIQLVNQIKVYHPYGSVGSLPWQSAGDTMDFGAEPKASQLLSLTRKIMTFAEGTDPDSSDILEIKNHICNLNKLVFIGFAFHKLNMQLISPPDCDNTFLNMSKCYATTLRISDSDKEVVREQINSLYPSSADNKIDVNMANLKCNAFFSEFWRSLAF